MTDREFTELMEMLVSINAKLAVIMGILTRVESGKSAFQVKERKS